MPLPAYALGRVTSLHPMGPRGVFVATDRPLGQLRVPVHTGSAVAFRRDGDDDLHAVLRGVGAPGPAAAAPVLVLLVDARVAARVAPGDEVWLCA